MTHTPYDHTAKLFHVLSHPARLQILDELRRAKACVCHLQAVLERPQPYVSQQLQVLREAGLVEDNREGVNVYYRLADRHVEELLKHSLGPAGPPTRLVACPCPCCQEEEG
jgi:ArsR family transcriptional regulator